MTMMRLNLEKLAQPIPSGDATAHPMETNDLFGLVQRLDVPLHIDELQSAESSLSERLGMAIPPMRQPNPTLAALLLKGREPAFRGYNGLPSPSMAPIMPEGASILANSFLMTPIPEQILSSSGDGNVKSSDTSSVEPSPRLPPPPQHAAPVSKGRGGTRGGRHSRKGSKAAREVVKPVTTVENWAQCESCKKWRRLPATVDTDKLPDLWVCALNLWDPLRNTCDVPEETFPDLKHTPEPEPEPVVSTKKTRNSRVSMPVRPVVSPSSGKAHSDRLMDHEVLELLLSENGDHPLRERLTLHSLDRASLLASELPHDVLMLGDIPLKRSFQTDGDFIDGAGHLIRPEEDLLKDDPSFRDDGTLSIGVARKTKWSSSDYDASTVDTVEGVDPGLDSVSRSTLAALFPQLALQVPKLQTPIPPLQKVSVKQETSHKGRKASQKETLSAMNQDDLMEIVSVFVSQQAKRACTQTRKHCQLEEKMRTSSITMESFLQPLSMLALPLPYSSTTSAAQRDNDLLNRKLPLKAEDLQTDPTPGDETADAVTSSVKSEHTRRRSVMPTTKAVDAQTGPVVENPLSRIREDYVRRSVGKTYFKKLKNYHPDIDYPAPDSRRLSKRITSRYTNGMQQAAATTTATTTAAGVDTCLDGSFDMVAGLALTERLQASEIPEDLEMDMPQAMPSYKNAELLFGVNMAFAVEMLNQPIATDWPSSPRSGKSSAKRHKGMCGPGSSIPGTLKTEIATIPSIDVEDGDINMDVYKNPRLLTEV